MATDNNVEISFGASVGDALDGIAQIRGALSDLTAPIGGIGGSLDRLGASFGTAMPLDLINRDARAWAGVGDAAQLTSAQQKILLTAEVNQFKITQDEKYALLERETQREFDVEAAALRNKLATGLQQGVLQKDVMDKLQSLETKHATAMLRLNTESVAAQQKLWTGYLSTVTGAFNSQLRGLLEGTTSWHKASVKMLEDLSIKFIEKAEEMVVRWLAGEIAKTTATTTGAAARTEAEEAASSATMLSGIANAASAIMRDAAQAFAGVFAFLAPEMGPAAAVPAAAAEATVGGVLSGFATGTDYVVRGGLAIIHPGETIIPAARGTGPYTGAQSSPQIHAPVSINVSALDSRSVARFFNDNSRHVLRAINDAVKRGAHLGVRGGTA